MLVTKIALFMKMDWSNVRDSSKRRNIEKSFHGKKIGNQFETWMVSTGGRRGMEEVGTT